MISDTIEEIATNIENAYDELETKGATLPDNKNIENLADTIASIETGGVSTQAQSIFTGYTAPLTWRDSTNNVFTYESATHNITITGLSEIATITGNGTKSVTVTIDTTASANRQTAFTIACEYDGQTTTYNGIAFHYGSDLGSGYCLAVAQTLTASQIAYVFIESDSLPTFSLNTTSWNGVYSHQIIGFDFGKWQDASIDNYFLGYCYSFNQPITIPSGVTSIGDNFMRYCYPFNQPVVIPNNVTSIGNYFLGNCYSFNQPITIPSGITSIGTYFLGVCYSFNQHWIIPDNVTSIGNSFLYYCCSFNQPLTIPNNVTSIGTYFLGYCYSFNQPITIPNNVTSIGNYFLGNCTSFNQPITIPSSVTSIGTYFLSTCYSFNQPLTISSSVTSIGDSFMYNCHSFNQPMIVPSGVASVSTNFMRQCYSFIYLEYNAGVYPTDNNSLSQTLNTKTSSAGTGIYVTGTGASGLKSALPDRTASPYRKLV